MRTASRRMVSIASWSSLVYPMLEMNEEEDDVSWSVNQLKSKWTAKSERSKKKGAAVGLGIWDFEFWRLRHDVGGAIAPRQNTQNWKQPHPISIT